jgi:S-DNA-T family DNA segregation ATPase FtsK/SpoIIIE
MSLSTTPLADHIPDVVVDAARRVGARAAGLALLGFVVVAGLALVTWSARDPSFNHAVDGPTRNAMGAWGAVVADLAMQLLGLGAIAALTPPAFWGWRLTAHGRLERPLLRCVLFLIGATSAAGVASLAPRTDRWPLPTGLGGVVGDSLLSVPRALFGESAATMVAGLALLLCAILCLTAAAGFGLLRARDEDVAPYETTPRADALERQEADDADGEPGFALILAGAAIHFALSAKAAVARPFSSLRRALAGSRATRAARRAEAPTPPKRPERPSSIEAAAAPVRREPSFETALSQAARVGRVEPRFDEARAAPFEAAQPLSRPSVIAAGSRPPAASLAPTASAASSPPRVLPRPSIEPEQARAFDDEPFELPRSRRALAPPAFEADDDGLAPFDPDPAPWGEDEPPHVMPSRRVAPSANALRGGEAASHVEAAGGDFPSKTEFASKTELASKAELVSKAEPASNHDVAAWRAPEAAPERAISPRPAPARPSSAVAPRSETPAPRRGPKDAPTGAPHVYEHPRADMLAPPKKGVAPISDEVLEEYATQLEKVLEDFGVRGEIRQVHPGPVVTLYELQPPPGLKSSRVIGLADDIARSMSAISARVAVVQGRNVIGIELPNATRETVYLREMLESRDFQGSQHKLAIALGKTIGGEPVLVDLAKMPHLLVAGTTGSGKSVAINTMILSLLYRLKPDQCRLIMVDPKMLELSVYDGIPHLLTPVVTDPKKAVVALKWAVREMEDRYKKMSKVGVRNIDGFNARVSEAKAKGEVITRQVQTGFDRNTGELIYETEEMDLSPLPYIVVIVDEMADLMMVAGKDIEGAIQRLAQMARAAGIHLIMATQRPSVDVITGTIKANFPTRISFQVTSKIDSRTILGEQGAEQLLGQGDMLYMAGGGRISRVHGPFVSDAEVERVVAHLKLQGAPEYLDAITRDEEEGGDEDGPAPGLSAGEGEETGDLYDRAVAIVLRDKRVSTSYIQRRLSVGYNKAASLIERMEKEGVVSAPSHSGKREILAGGGIDRGAFELGED